jgi:SNF2 family DNA or RNA helicase
MSLAAAFTPVASDIPPLFQHQQETVEFHRGHSCVMNHSSPGVGKTASWLTWFARHRDSGGGTALILAPKTILQSAWAVDAERFTPELKVSIATAENRRDGLKPGADLYLTNHDAVRALAKDPSMLPPGLDSFCVDESTAFKSMDSQRTRAAMKLLAPFERRCLMTGTPMPNSVLDVFMQALICDRGERLGTSFWRFRDAVCHPEPVAPGSKFSHWIAKPGAAEWVADALRDITIQFRLEDVLDLPPVVEYTQSFVLNPAHRAAYERLRSQGLLLLQDRVIGAAHAAALRQKLLQLLSGAVYDGEGVAETFSTDRYRLVLDLVEARPASLVAFLWRHQRDALVRAAQKRGITHAVLDGSVPARMRADIVQRFQDGQLHALFAHPATASHGLTLTRGVATIWCSPPDSSEWFTQMNHRLHRAGQTQRVEVIRVVARHTLEERAYAQLGQKLDAQTALLDLLR